MQKPEFEQPKQNGLASWLIIFLVVSFGGAVFTGLSFLTLGLVSPVLAIAGIVFLLIGFHYLVWGWWLGAYLKKRHDFDEEI